jgi:hypothetical protein
MYALLVTALSFFSRSEAIAPQWYLAPIIAFLIALIATLTAGVRVALSRPVRIAARMWALVIGASLVVVTILIFMNFSQVKDITTTLQPGFFGGLLLLFLNLLYLPNAAVALASYFAGTGLAVGAGTLVSPLWYHLGQIPALPLLGILPTGKQPFALIGIFVFIGLGVLLARWSLVYGIQALIQSYIFTVVGAILMGYLASGSLMTAEMGAMGVSIWKFALSIAVEVGVGAAATTLIMNRNLR